MIGRPSNLPPNTNNHGMKRNTVAAQRKHRTSTTPIPAPHSSGKQHGNPNEQMKKKTDKKEDKEAMNHMDSTEKKMILPVLSETASVCKRSADKIQKMMQRSNQLKKQSKTKEKMILNKIMIELAATDKELLEISACLINRRIAAQKILMEKGDSWVLGRQWQKNCTHKNEELGLWMQIFQKMKKAYPNTRATASETQPRKVETTQQTENIRELTIFIEDITLFLHQTKKTIQKIQESCTVQSRPPKSPVIPMGAADAKSNQHNDRKSVGWGKRGNKQEAPHRWKKGIEEEMIHYYELCYLREKLNELGAFLSAEQNRINTIMHQIENQSTHLEHLPHGEAWSTQESSSKQGKNNNLDTEMTKK